MKNRTSLMVLIAGVLLASFLFQVTYNKIEYYTAFPLMLNPPKEKNVGPDDGGLMFAFVVHHFVFLFIVFPSFLYLLTPFVKRKEALGAKIGASALVVVGLAGLYIGSMALGVALHLTPFIGSPQ